MPLKPREIRNCLLTKFGFSPVEGSSPDHEWYELTLPGRRRVRTKIHRHRAEYGPILESKVARQLRVRRPFFMEMVRCTKDLDDYVQQVETAPYPPWETRVIR